LRAVRETCTLGYFDAGRKRRIPSYLGDFLCAGRFVPESLVTKAHVPTPSTTHSPVRTPGHRGHPRPRLGGATAFAESVAGRRCAG
jgi:hypothetical protein